MLKIFFLASLISLAGLQSNAQVTNVSLQAAGLTCSMCSKAVLNALEKVPFVDKVGVDIKNQRYDISFKEKAAIDLDALTKAVEDAGFSVASFKVTADLNKIKLEKDKHILIGREYFHFLNGTGQQLNGTTTFMVVDKGFTSAKNFKKYSALSKMECVKTGHAANCCKDLPGETRIYHAII